MVLLLADQLSENLQARPNFVGSYKKTPREIQPFLKGSTERLVSCRGIRGRLPCAETRWCLRHFPSVSHLGASVPPDSPRSSHSLHGSERPCSSQRRTSRSRTTSPSPLLS